jgi:hypothetical protein
MIIRPEIQAEIDRLSLEREFKDYSLSWIKFAFERGMQRGRRLTCDEWVYLAEACEYKPAWASNQYNSQEFQAHHKYGLISIEKEVELDG